MANVKKDGRFVIRVYKMQYCFDRYDDQIYRVPESAVNPADVRLSRYADSQEELLRRWNELLERYEGYTYCVKDLQTGALLVGGVFDPSDDEYIKEYFE